MSKRAYFKGYRLWQDYRTFNETPEVQLGRLVGVTRLYGDKNPDSPSAFLGIEIETVIDAFSTVAELDQQDVFHVAKSQIVRDLLALGQTVGDLSICPDSDMKANVTSSFLASGGVQAVTHDTPGGSWTTAAGRYVLVRDPSSGEGWVAQIQSRTSGSITIDVEQDITSDWDIVNVYKHWPDVVPGPPDFGSMPGSSSASDKFRPSGGVRYPFVGSSAVVIASALQQDFS